MRSKTFLAVSLPALITIALTSSAFAQSQAVDEEYTRLIREATTRPEFMNPLVDHLPKVDGVPTPKDVIGHISGAPDKLIYYDDAVKYLKALADATPNIKVFSYGKSGSGKDLTIAAVSSAENIANLKKYTDLISRLADPRKIQTEEQAAPLIAEAKPIYWITATMHVGETSATQKIPELAYRLAVEDTPLINKIREDAITLLTPSLTPDGYDIFVDWYYKYNKDVTERSQITRPTYIGKYNTHANRDGFCLASPESKAEMDAFFEFRPIIINDEHESVPFLYVQGGSGPYNTVFDPAVRAQWTALSWWEVFRLNELGMPGVHSHSMWDGWSPVYFFMIANTHNAFGRFYETFGNAIGNTMERELQDRQVTDEWWRPWPPYKKVLWSMRNAVNYNQTGDLVALNFVATHKDEFLHTFWQVGVNSLNRGKNEAPHAFIIPAGQKDPLDVAYLVNTLLLHRVEIHQATSPINVSDGSFPSGSYVIRLDQPYRDLIVNFLGIQKFPDPPPRSYEDTGWTLGLHMDVKTVEIEDKAIFKAALSPVTQPVKVTAQVAGGQATGAYIIKNATINNLVTARFKLEDTKVLAAEESFSAEGKSFDAGSMIIPVSGASNDVHSIVQSIASDLGLEVVASAAMPNVKTHELYIPRIGFFHTWYDVSDEAWVRIATDRYAVPYTYIDKDDIKEGNLKAKFDVILIPSSRGNNAAAFVNGVDPKRGPLAYVKSDEFKYLGYPDSSEDITGGMGNKGVSNLRDFVEEGGTLITLLNSARLPVELGMTRDITIYNPSDKFYNPGSLLKAEVVNPASPIAYGYEKDIVLYRRHSGPLLNIPEAQEDYVVMEYATEGDLCLSGIVQSQDEIKGKAAIVDVPLGKGHIVMFTFNPFWREMSHGSYMFVFNTILNYNDLGKGVEERPTTEMN
jgi:hypothetical protein